MRITSTGRRYGQVVGIRAVNCNVIVSIEITVIGVLGRDRLDSPRCFQIALLARRVELEVVSAVDRTPDLCVFRFEIRSRTQLVEHSNQLRDWVCLV